MKISEKIKSKKDKKLAAITQQNLEESREEIIAKGKKFKYPFQYAKHRLIINAILIGIVAVVAMGLVGWYQLYKAQNTGEVMYRFTRSIALSVADVDGVKVRFSDYLMLYRSSIASVERQQGAFDDSEGSRQQKEYYKRQALSAAEDYSYAMHLLDEAGKAVTEDEIDEIIEEHKIIDGEKRSDEAFEGIIRDNFGLSIRDYRRLIMLSLAKKKASVEFDTEARETVEKIAETLKTNADMAAVMKDFAESETVSYELVEEVDYTNLDSGRAEAAALLAKPGDISDYFVSKNGDGYYIVKLKAKTDNKVSYESIWVRFRKIDSEMAKLREDGKVKEMIDLGSDEEIVAPDEAETDESEDAEKSGE